MIAFDYSITSPSMCFLEGDVVNIHYITPKKKFGDVVFVKPSFRIVGHYYDHKKEDHDDITRYGKLASIFSSVLDSNYTGEKIARFEAYAFGAKGMLANIGECTGVMKHELVKKGFSIQTVSPTSVKKYATGSGAAKKEDMAQAFYEFSEFYMHDLVGNKKMGDSPSSDIVDSFYVHCYEFENS